MCPASRTALDKRNREHTILVVVTACVSGLMRGTFGISSAAFMVLQLYYSIDQPTWRWLAFATGMLNATMQGLLLGGYGNNFDWSCWPTYLVLTVGGLVGL